MITMDQYEYIRIAHRVYGKGIRQIQRESGHDRKTIRKALREEPYGYPNQEFKESQGKIGLLSK